MLPFPSRRLSGLVLAVALSPAAAHASLVSVLNAAYVRAIRSALD